jgi:hypothetical protein
MTPALRKGLIVATLHIAIVSSLGAKLLVDRATRPRLWVQTAPVDPNLPIRGRYIRLGVEAIADPGLTDPPQSWVQVVLSERDGRLFATKAPGAGLAARIVDRGGERRVMLVEPLAYFIPEHVADPSRRLPEKELWVEVTIPRAGAPRPIRLGVKKDGVLKPIDD